MRSRQLLIFAVTVLVLLVSLSGLLIGNGYSSLAFLLVLSLFILIFLLGRRNRISTADRSRSFVVIAVTVIVGLNLVAIPRGAPVQAALATVMLIVCFYPTWRYLRTHDTRLPFMPLLCIIYALQHAVPIFIPVDRYPTYAYASPGTYQTALIYALVGMVIMLIVYYSWPEHWWKGIVPRFQGLAGDLTTPRAIFWAILMGIVGIVAYTFISLGRVSGSLTSLVNFLGQTSLLAVAILLYLQLQRRLNVSGYIFLWGILIPLYFVTSLTTGFIWPVIRGLAVLALVYVWIKRQIPWMWIGIAAAATMLLLVAKPAFRALTWNDQILDPNPAATIARWSQVIRDSVIDDEQATTEGIQSAINRMDVNALFATVIDRTPSVVPYWEGKTYQNILVAFLPRFLYPDKPTEDLGQEFGHRYSFLDPNNTTTSVNVPQIVEMYVNFGPVGILIGMAIMGILYKLFQYVLENPEAGTWGRLSAVLVYAQLASTESNFTVVFGNMLYWLLLLYLLGRIIFVPPAHGPKPSAHARPAGVDGAQRQSAE